LLPLHNSRGDKSQHGPGDGSHMPPIVKEIMEPSSGEFALLAATVNRLPSRAVKDNPGSLTCVPSTWLRDKQF
jgi:hypothetical protein